MLNFTFILEDDAFKNSKKITYEFERVDIDGIVSEFENFLRGCGFSINGNLQFIENETMVDDRNTQLKAEEFLNGPTSLSEITHNAI